MSSAKKGFLLTDALIAVFVVGIMAIIVNCALISHANTAAKTKEAIYALEEEASWHLSNCARCVKEQEGDSSLNQP